VRFSKCIDSLLTLLLTLLTLLLHEALPCSLSAIRCICTTDTCLVICRSRMKDAFLTGMQAGGASATNKGCGAVNKGRGCRLRLSHERCCYCRRA
jgi:hypothetical protein